MNIPEEFEKFLKLNLPKRQSFHPYFDEAYREMFDAGGKRFRPLLLLNIVKVLNPLLVKNAMYAALAVEMIHTYSLIHDDLPAMDNAQLRRGKTTLHVTYNEVTAILVADALNTDAFLVLSKMPIDAQTKNRLCSILAENAGSYGMVLGQAIDCYFENRPLDEEQLIFLHTQKTAKLIAASLKMGAVIAGAKEKLIDELYNFGLELGLLFQIQDDIIDSTKTPAQIGKPINQDSAKNSFTNLFGLQEAIKKRDGEICNLKMKAEKFGEKLNIEFLKILNNSFK